MNQSDMLKLHQYDKFLSIHFGYFVILRIFATE